MLVLTAFATLVLTSLPVPAADQIRLKLLDPSTSPATLAECARAGMPQATMTINKQRDGLRWYEKRTCIYYPTLMRPPAAQQAVRPVRSSLHPLSSPLKTK